MVILAASSSACLVFVTAFLSFTEIVAEGGRRGKVESAQVHNQTLLDHSCHLLSEVCVLIAYYQPDSLFLHAVKTTTTRTMLAAAVMIRKAITDSLVTSSSTYEDRRSRERDVYTWQRRQITVPVGASYPL